MNKNKLNFVFWGTPDVASETLQILKDEGFLPSLIITSPDKPQGRKMLITPPSVKTWAIENNIQYLQPKKLTSVADLLVGVPNLLGTPTTKWDLAIVVAYGKIIPENILEMPEFGSINVHYSLLPKYRGASPVESAILNGDIETGVSIQKMIYKMDAGDILAKVETDILSTETAPELRKRLVTLGGKLLVKIIPECIQNKITPISQDESLATNCSKIKKEYGLVDLNGDAVKNYNKFRAYAYWPRTFFFKDGKRIIITEAHLENDKFIIDKIIPEGGKEINYKT